MVVFELAHVLNLSLSLYLSLSLSLSLSRCVQAKRNFSTIKTHKHTRITVQQYHAKLLTIASDNCKTMFAIEK